MSLTTRAKIFTATLCTGLLLFVSLFGLVGTAAAATSQTTLRQQQAMQVAARDTVPHKAVILLSPKRVSPDANGCADVHVTGKYFSPNSHVFTYVNGSVYDILHTNQHGVFSRTFIICGVREGHYYRITGLDDRGRAAYASFFFV